MRDLSVEEFEKWLSGLPSDGQYLELDSRHCLLVDYVREHLRGWRVVARGGTISYESSWHTRGPRVAAIPPQIAEAVAGWPRTHGALLARLRRAPAAARSPAELARA